MFRPQYALHLIAVLAAAIGFSLAHAAAPGAIANEQVRVAQYGVWRGAVGKQEVMAKLAPAACKPSYYYLRHLVDIKLAEQDKRGQTWTEVTPGNPAWKFETASANTLDGKWIAADGKRSVPIHLRLVAVSNGNEGSCGNLDDAFDGPRAILREQAITDQRFGEHRYRAISVLNGNVNGIEIPEDEFRLPNLNNAMRTWLYTKIDGYYSCGGDEADFHEKMAPAFWDRQILVLKETYSMYCGGAHPSDGVADYRTWNLATDKEMNVWDWIRDSTTEYGRDPPQQLKALILAMKPKDTGDCADLINDATPYFVHPNENGLVFSTDLPHAARGCDRDIEIPYARMLPYLTPEGTAAVRALMKGHHP